MFSTVKYYSAKQPFAPIVKTVKRIRQNEGARF